MGIAGPRLCAILVGMEPRKDQDVAAFERLKPEQSIAELTCPKCGGELTQSNNSPLIGESKRRCSTCGKAWSAKELKRVEECKASNRTDSPVGQQDHLLATVFILCGLFCLVFLALRWLQLENAMSADLHSDPLQEFGRRRLFRNLVPILGGCWFALSLCLITGSMSRNLRINLVVGWLVAGFGALFLL